MTNSSRVRVRVLCSDIEETPSGGVEATFTRDDPPGPDEDPRRLEYWHASKAGKSRWYLSKGPTRILLHEPVEDDEIQTA